MASLYLFLFIQGQIMQFTKRQREASKAAKAFLTEHNVAIPTAENPLPTETLMALADKLGIDVEITEGENGIHTASFTKTEDRHLLRVTLGTMELVRNAVGSVIAGIVLKHFTRELIYEASINTSYCCYYGRNSKGEWAPKDNARNETVVFMNTLLTGWE